MRLFFIVAVRDMRGFPADKNGIEIYGGVV